MKRLLTLTAAAPLLLASCGKSAESAMKGFCSDLSAGRWEQAVTRLGAEGDLQDTLKDPQARQLMNAMLGTAKCKVVAAKDHTVTLEMDTVNGQAVATTVMADAMGMALTAAAGGLDRDQALQDALVAKLIAGLTSKDAPRSVNRVDVELKQEGGEWVPVESNDPFASALTGGMDKFGE